MPEDVFAAAVAEATSEVNGDPTPDPTPEPDKPASEPTPEPEPESPTAEAKPSAPAKDPVPTADADDIDFINPTAEDLAAIEASPQLQRVYKSMQRGLTKKSQELAAARKTLQQESEVVQWIRNDPEAAIRSIARATGVTLEEAQAQVEEKLGDDLEAKWAKTVGPEAAQLLRPLIEETIKSVMGPELQPIKATTEQAQRVAVERGISASVREFGAAMTERGEEWDDEIQADMARIADTLEPGKDTTLPDYIANLYDAAIARRMRTKSARATRDRLLRVRAEAEPNTTVRPAPKSEERITTDMSDKDAIAIAVRQAKQGLGMR